MRRLAALVVAGAAFATVPAEARMAKSVLFSTSPAFGLEGDVGVDEPWSPSVQPVGFVDWVREIARAKPRAVKPARNDITETLEAMQIARLGVAGSPRCGVKPTPAR